MEENIISKESNTKFLFKIVICFALLFMLFLIMQEMNLLGTGAVFAAEIEQSERAEKKYIYLSDISYIKEQSSVGWQQQRCCI